MSGWPISSAMFDDLHAAAVLDADGVGRLGAGQLGDTCRGSAAHTCWASSDVAVRPVPIAQIGS